MEKISFVIDKKIVYVECKITNNKNAYLKVTRDNKLLITRPRHVSKEQIIKAFSGRVKTLLEPATKPSNSLLYSLADRYIFLNGEKLGIKFLTGFFQSQVKVSKTSFYIMTRTGTPFECEKTLKDYLKFETLQYVARRQRFFEQKMQVKPHQIKVSYKFTTWATNNRRLLKINYSARLMHFDCSVRDYVIVHELAHFFEPKHSTKFYAIIARILPNYKLHQRKLRTQFASFD